MEETKPPDIPGERTTTVCMSLSGLLPEEYRHALLPTIRHRSQILGDLTNRATLLLNFHFTRLCELHQGFPLDHAPLCSPLNIISWAHKILDNPEWIPRCGFSECDRPALEHLRESAKLLDAQCLESTGRQFLVPGVIKTLGGTFVIDDFKSTLQTNMLLHLRQIRLRIKTAIARLYGEQIKETLKRGERKLVHQTILDAILPPYSGSDGDDEVLGNAGAVDDECDEVNLVPARQAAQEFIDARPGITAFINDANHLLELCVLIATALDEQIKQGKQDEEMPTYVASGAEGGSDDGDDMDCTEPASLHQDSSPVYLFLKKRPLAFLPFFYFLQQCCHQVNAENNTELQVFTLLPVNKRQRVHLKMNPLSWLSL